MASVMVIDACGKIGFMLSLRQKMAGGNKGGRRVVDMAISGLAHQLVAAASAREMC
jgi:hypothetical protein